MNNNIVSRTSSATFKGFLNQVNTEKQLLPLAGFATVKSVIQFTNENLFAFKSDPDLCVHFKSDDCTGLTFTGTVHRRIKGHWLDAGMHTFNLHGSSNTIFINWNDIIICD